MDDKNDLKKQLVEEAKKAGKVGYMGCTGHIAA